MKINKLKIAIVRRLTVHSYITIYFWAFSSVKKLSLINQGFYKMGTKSQPCKPS